MGYNLVIHQVYCRRYERIFCCIGFYLYTHALDTLDFMTIREVDRLHHFALFYLFGDLSLAQIGAER